MQSGGFYMVDPKGESVYEYHCKNAIIRIHGEPDMERIKKASMRFMRRVLEAEEKENALRRQPPTESM
jgi:hypothetical protein